MDYLGYNIAVNLKRIRKAKGMSLEQVAEQTGVSKSMLANIESGHGNPSIAVIGKIISGLRLDLTDLTEAPPDSSYLVDADQLFPTKRVEGQYTVWTVFPIADNRKVEIYRIEIEPGGEYFSGGHGERTREYLTMIQGSISVLLKDGAHSISGSQSFRFESDQDHTYRNEGNITARFMSFFVVY